MPIVKINDRPVQVDIAQGAFPFDAERGKSPIELIREFKAFRDYCDNMDPALIVRSIKVEGVTMFGPRIGFLFMNADIVRAEDGSRVPGAVFLRGGAAVILTVLVCEGREYVVVVYQARQAVGKSAFIGFPAGMFDDAHDLKGKAIEELREEVGLDIDASQLVDLTEMAFPTERGMYCSAGGSDEFVRIMLYRRQVTPDELATFQGRATGLREHGEHITTGIVPLDEVWKVSPDYGIFASLYLYERLRPRL